MSNKRPHHPGPALRNPQILPPVYPDLLPDAAELSRDEIVELLERESKRRLGMSADRMLRGFAEGTLADSGTVGDLIVLSDLLQEDDPLIVTLRS